MTGAFHCNVDRHNLLPGRENYSRCSLYELNEHVSETSRDTEFSSEILLTSLRPQVESPLAYILENCVKERTAASRVTLLVIRRGR